MLKAILKTNDNDYLSTEIRETNRPHNVKHRIDFSKDLFKDIPDNKFEVIVSITLYDEDEMICFRKIPKKWDPIYVHNNRSVTVTYTLDLELSMTLGVE